MKRLLILVFLFSGIFFTNVPSVLACSGPYNEPVPLQVMLERDIFFKGVIIENSAGNSIVQVEEYFIGTGEAQVFIHRQSPEAYRVRRERGYDFGCNYALRAIGAEGTRGYFSLDRNPDGTHNVSYISAPNFRSIYFHEDEPFIGYMTYDGDYRSDIENNTYDTEKIEYFAVPPAEFEEILIERIGQQPTQAESSTYDYQLRYRPLHITTESGQQYVLPIDRNIPQLLDDIEPECTENCIIISPDGTHFAHPIPEEDDQYAIWYRETMYIDNWWDGWAVGNYYYYPPRISAQALMFSPSGDYLLAWNDNLLTIYAFNIYVEYRNNGGIPTLYQVHQIELTTTGNLSATSLHGQAIWSTNESVLAFWDADGLHWIDINMMAEPRLIVPFESTSNYLHPTATQANTETIIPDNLRLSTTGRYVTYGTSAEWELLDVLTEVTIDDGIISPDENFIVQVSPEAPLTTDFSPVEMGTCTTPLTNCYPSLGINPEYTVQDVYWRNDTAIIFVCDTENLCTQYTYSSLIDTPYANSHYPSISDEHINNDYAFEDTYQYLAWAINDYIVVVSDGDTYPDRINMADILDSPITSIEWGAPLWYVAP